MTYILCVEGNSMFMLKAAALGLQNPQQTSVAYLGKDFGQVKTFRLDDRAMAEVHCRDASKSGQLTILVEFPDALAMYCEGVLPSGPSFSQPVMPQVVSTNVSVQPNQVTVVTPLSLSDEIVANESQTYPSINYNDKPPAAVEPQYREISYRGAVIRKPIQASEEAHLSKPRHYRGASY